MVSRLHFLFLIFFFSLATVQAQQNPVNVNVNVIPPYSMYLSDYMQGSNKVVVTLVNQSINETRRVKLQWNLSGTNNDVSARTEQDAMPQNPIVLQPGQSITLSSQELRSRYQSFSRQDIEVEGMDLRSNLSNQTLPEGIYNLCAQALQYETNEPLSADQPVGCSQPIRISIVDPPKIISPRDQTSISSTSPQFLNFNWVPVNTRNANIQYRFKIVDITGADISPYDAMQSQNFKVYESRNLNQNFINYGMAKPLLEDGHRYAVQVQAYDPTNQIRIKNDGKSEIHTFTYKSRGFGLDGPLLPDSLTGFPLQQEQAEGQPEDTTQLMSTGAKGKGTYNCGSGCKFDISNINKQHSTQIGQGDTIQMGYFDVYLQAATNSPSGIGGLGTITNANFMQSGSKRGSAGGNSNKGKSNKLIVSLKDVKVNQYGRAFDGTAQIEVDKGMLKNFVQGEKASEYIKKGISLKKLYGKLSGLKSDRQKAPVNFISGKAHVKMISLKLTPEKATAQLVGMLEVQDDRIRNEYMAFSSSDVCINPGGPAISEEKAYLQLAKPVTVDISKNYTVTLLPPENQNKKQEKGTYLNFDCDGFRDVQAYGMVKFSRDLVKPRKKNGKISPQDTLAATFTTAFQNWDHWVAQLDFTSLPSQINQTQKLATDKFGYKKLPGYTFQVKKAYMDHSSKEDLFQKMGSSNPVPGNAGAGWQGVYVSQAEVWLPSFFSKKQSAQQNKNKNQGNNSDEPIHLTGTDMAFDASGVSADIFGTRVLNNGAMDNMPVSIDTVDVEIRRNMLEKARLTGGITIPVFQDPMPYQANITYTNQKASYSFDLKTGKRRRIPMWMVTTQLDPNSTVHLDIRQEDVDFEANLNGRLYFDPTLGAVPDVRLEGLRFENFTISSREPYLDISNFGVNTNLEEPQVVGYPTDLKNLRLKTPKGPYSANLHFDLRFNLSDQRMSQISGESELRLYSRIDTQMTQTGRVMPNFKFRGAEIDSVRLNAQYGPLQFQGSLDMYKNDPTFGSGFDGDLQLKAFGSPAFTGNALFGQKEQSNNILRYWYVDGMATFMNASVPLGGAVGLYGFGGGAYYNLKRKGTIEAARLQSNPVRNTASIRNQYEPQKGTLGIKASTIIGLHMMPFVINGDALMEVAFKRNPFGLKSFSFDGKGYALTGLQKRSNPAIYGDLDADYKKNTSFRFGASYDINVPPQMPILTGDGQVDFKARLGSNSNYWYLHFGTPAPANRINLSLGIKDFTLASASGYFMAGKKLLPPQLPDQVSNYFDRDISSLNQKELINKGEGVAAGLSFNADMEVGGDVARLEASAGLGANVTLMRYNPPVQCNGMSDFGLDRWYANGMGYLYGDLGFFLAKKEVFGVNAGTLMEVGLPDPVGFKGRVKAGIHVMGGTINFDQQVQIGNICSFEVAEGKSLTVESPVEELEFISDVRPSNQKSGLDLFVAPQITFNKNVYHNGKKTYTFSDGKGGTQETTYRFDFSYSWEKEIQPGQWASVGSGVGEVRSDYESASRSLNLALKKDYSSGVSGFAEDYRQVMLDGNTTYRLQAKVVVKEKTGQRSWKTATYSADSLKGQKIRQVITHTFTTGSAPDVFPDKRVDEVVPARRRRFFTQDDYNRGYVKFTTNISSVWDSLDTEGYVMKAKFEPISGQGNEILEDVGKYNNGRELRFDIPRLANETTYQLQIIATPPSGETTGSDEGTTTDKPGETIWGDSESGQAQSTKISKAKGAVNRVTQDLVTRVLFTSYFKTSQFNTLQAKIDAMEVGKTRVKSEPIPPIVTSRHNLEGYNRYDMIEVTFTGPEPFGRFDVSRQHEGGAAIHVEDQGTVHGWHSQIDQLWKGSFCMPDGIYTEVTDGWQFPVNNGQTTALWNPSDPNSTNLVMEPLSDAEVGLEQSSGHAEKNFNRFTMPEDYTTDFTLTGGNQKDHPEVLRVRYYGDLNARTNWGNKRQSCGEDDHYLLDSYPEVEQGDQMYLQLSGNTGTGTAGITENEFTITLNP